MVREINFFAFFIQLMTTWTITGTSFSRLLTETMMFMVKESVLKITLADGGKQGVLPLT